jgi:hypothetical protein
MAGFGVKVYVQGNRFFIPWGFSIPMGFIFKSITACMEWLSHLLKSIQQMFAARVKMPDWML